MARRERQRRKRRQVHEQEYQSILTPPLLAAIGVFSLITVFVVFFEILKQTKDDKTSLVQIRTMNDGIRFYAEDKFQVNKECDSRNTESTEDEWFNSCCPKSITGAIDNKVVWLCQPRFFSKQHPSHYNNGKVDSKKISQVNI